MTSPKSATSKTTGKKTPDKTVTIPKPAAVKTASAAPSLVPTPASKPDTPKPVAPAEIAVGPVVVPAISILSGVTVAPAAGDAVDAPMLKKQEFVERVVLASGAKKRDVKGIVEAALAVLGDALTKGEELNLPPLGKVKVNRTRDEGANEVIILKLRRGGGSGAQNPTKDGLAEDREDE